MSVSLKSAITAIVFKIADLPSFNNSLRHDKEKALKRYCRVRFIVLEKACVKGEINDVPLLKRGDLDRLVQIMKFMDPVDPYSWQSANTVVLFITKNLAGIPNSFLKPSRKSLRQAIVDLSNFVIHAEQIIRECTKCKLISKIEEMSNRIVSLIKLGKYHLDDFYPDDGWHLQKMQASDLCVYSKTFAENIQFIFVALTGGDERKRYFSH